MKCEECKYFELTDHPGILTDGICRLDGLFVFKFEEFECGVALSLEEMRALIGGLK